MYFAEILRETLWCREQGGTRAYTQVGLPTFHQRCHYCEFRHSPAAEQSLGPLQEARTPLRSQRALASPGFWGNQPEHGESGREEEQEGL